MSEATGTTTVVVETPDGSPLVATLDNSTGEVLATGAEAPAPEVEVEVVETVADSAVEIAQIEADARVEVEGIRADVEIAAIEARAEGQERVEEWRTEMTLLRTDLSVLAEAVTATATVVEQLVANQSTPQVLSETVTEPEAMTDTSETQTETSSETVMEVPVVSVVESPAPLVEVMRRKVRMI